MKAVTFILDKMGVDSASTKRANMIEKSPKLREDLVGASLYEAHAKLEQYQVHLLV